jgi:hypothetical protein
MKLPALMEKRIREIIREELRLRELEREAVKRGLRRAATLNCD